MAALTPWLAFDRASYETLWQAADDIERRFLSMAFRLEIDADGWTVDGYTLTELHDLMQYPPSSASRPRLKEIMERYIKEGILQTHPPRGHRRRLRFTFILSSASERPSQRTMNVILDHNESDRGSQSAAAASSSAAAPLLGQNVIRDHRQCDPGSSAAGSGITLAAADDHDDLIKGNNPSLDQSDQPSNPHDLLRAASVNLKQFSADMLHVAETMPIAHLRTIIENAEAGKKIGRVTSVQGFIYRCITNYDGRVSTDYLDEYHEQQAALEAKRAAEEAEREREAYLNSPEYRDELARLQAERKAREAARQAEYEAARTAFEALLEGCQKVERESYWWDRWLSTLGQLEIQLHRATYNSWVADAEAIAFQEATNTLIVSVVHAYAKDWLEQRLYRLVAGSLQTISGHKDVQVRFVVRPEPPVIYAFKPLPEGIPGLTDRLAS